MGIQGTDYIGEAIKHLQTQRELLSAKVIEIEGAIEALEKCRERMNAPGASGPLPTARAPIVLEVPRVEVERPTTEPIGRGHTKRKVIAALKGRGRLGWAPPEIAKHIGAEVGTVYYHLVRLRRSSEVVRVSASQWVHVDHWLADQPAPEPAPARGPKPAANEDPNLVTVWDGRRN